MRKGTDRETKGETNRRPMNERKRRAVMERDHSQFLTDESDGSEDVGGHLRFEDVELEMSV